MKRLVLDANILIRAMIGSNVPAKINRHRTTTQFLTSETAYTELERHLPRILVSKHPDPEWQCLILAGVPLLRRLVTPIPESIFQSFEAMARERLRGRDEDDWHILALALALGSPIWTEDTDFFGIGVTTWKTSNIHLYFEDDTA